MTSARSTYLIILAGATLWCVALVAAPFLVTFSGFPGTVGGMIYGFFHPVCHQLDERSFHLFGKPLAVCSRCTSIYFAFLVGTLVYPVLREVRLPALPHRAFLFAALLPMAADVMAAVLGIHAITNTTRLFTGAAFGLAAPFFIIPAAIEALQQVLGQRAHLTDTYTEKGSPHA